MFNFKSFILTGFFSFHRKFKIGFFLLDIFPEKADFHFHLANVYGKTNQFEKAEEEFLKVIKINSKNAMYYVNFGVLYHRWKKLDKAKEMYKKALKIDPENASALRNLKSLQ